MFTIKKTNVGQRNSLKSQKLNQKIIRDTQRFFRSRTQISIKPYEYHQPLAVNYAQLSLPLKLLMWMMLLNSFIPVAAARIRDEGRGSPDAIDLGLDHDLSLNVNSSHILDQERSFVFHEHLADCPPYSLMLGEGGTPENQCRSIRMAISFLSRQPDESKVYFCSSYGAKSFDPSCRFWRPVEDFNVTLGSLHFQRAECLAYQRLFTEVKTEIEVFSNYIPNYNEISARERLLKIMLDLHFLYPEDSKIFFLMKVQDQALREKFPDYRHRYIDVIDELDQIDASNELEQNFEQSNRW